MRNTCIFLDARAITIISLNFPIPEIIFKFNQYITVLCRPTPCSMEVIMKLNPFQKPQQPGDLNAIITRLAKHLLTHRIDARFRELAREESASVSIEQLDQLRSLFHNPPPQSDVYDAKQHGLGGWLSACQFAIFELIYNMGADALPFIREIAWGEYDWTQGNAIELLLRFAAEGIRTEEILAEIKTNFPQIRYEAQLYCMQPLLPELEQNAQLKSIFDQLRNEIEEFQEAYAELTEEAEDGDSLN